MGNGFVEAMRSFGAAQNKLLSAKATAVTRFWAQQSGEGLQLRRRRRTPRISAVTDSTMVTLPSGWTRISHFNLLGSSSRIDLVPMPPDTVQA